MGDSGDILMGMPASEFKLIKENYSKEEIETYLNSLIFKDFSYIEYTFASSKYDLAILEWLWSNVENLILSDFLRIAGDSFYLPCLK